MKITLNANSLSCHRCGGSYNLEIISINDENKYNIWCNKCNEQTCEDVIAVDKIAIVDIWL